MDADWSVELGANDPTLAVPWASDDGRLRYHDLRAQPELLLYVEEASRFPELGEFLVAINSASSHLQTAKCDAWSTPELSEAEAVYGAACKFCSYVDLIFAGDEAQLSFEAHEQLVKRMSELLKKAPEISAAAEFIVRRAHYQQNERRGAETQRAVNSDGDAGGGDFVSGFYITFYLFGYGDDEDDARRRWAIALRLTGNAFLQVAAEADLSSKERAASDK